MGKFIDFFEKITSVTEKVILYTYDFHSRTQHNDEEERDTLYMPSRTDEAKIEFDFCVAESILSVTALLIGEMM